MFIHTPICFNFHDHNQVQRVIREGFNNSTVLTIAHRLDTILDCSRVLVLADGQVAEFASPATLLADTNSQFSGMAKGMEKHASTS